MKHLFRSFFAKDAAPAFAAATPEGQRIYAIGDIHGRADLLAELMQAIDADDASAAPAETLVILLGDLVDRGQDSAGVVRLAREWQARRNVRILAGNHEEMFLRSFDDPEMLRHFLRHGGRETIYSYGIDRRDYMAATLDELQRMMAEAVTPEERAFIAGFEDMIVMGDYVFVHAGINPALPFDQQQASDLRWIREPFLSHPEYLGAVVVHGHTITDLPVDTGNRIGIDTGAYYSGRLTALVLEGTERRYIEAVQDEAGNIAIAHSREPAL